MSRYQKGKTNLDFTEARDSECQYGISWAMCKSAPHSRQITTPAPHNSVFLQAGCSFLPPNQQRQSTEGTVFSYPTISKPLLSSNGFWAISFCQILLFRIVKGHTNKKLNIFGSPVVGKVQASYNDRGPQVRSCTSKTFGSDAHSFTTRGL